MRSGRLKILSLLLLTALFAAACSLNGGKTAETDISSETSVTSSESSEVSVEESSSATDTQILSSLNLLPVKGDDALVNEIESLPDVVAVGRIEEVSGADEYVIVFEFPIDHKDPKAGTFYQIASLKYRDRNAPTLFLCGGYEISYTTSEEKETHLSRAYNCNFIEAEFRCYGRSCIEGFSIEDPESYKVLNNEDASEDFHQMIENLKTVFSGKWIFEGSSKGGEFTCYQAYRHPEDADVFVAEAAMLRCGQNFPGMYKYAYTVAGDDRYGKKEAKEIRDLITSFQVEAIRYRDKIQDHLQDYTAGKKIIVPVEILFDCLVLDQVYYWQYCDQEYIDMVKDILSRKKDGKLTIPENDYCNKIFQAILRGYGPWQYEYFDPESSVLGYFNYQCYREDGNYLYDFSYLRKALAKEDKDLKLNVTEDMEKDIFAMRIPDKVREYNSYSSQSLEDRLSAVDKTSKPLILINGLTDIHSVSEITECQNPNVHIFNIPEAMHIEAEINYMSSEQREEFDSLLRSILD